MTKIAMALVATLTLSACMEGGNSVSRSAVPSYDCGWLMGTSAAGSVTSTSRCGPQTQLPYTLQ